MSRFLGIFAGSLIFSLIFAAQARPDIDSINTVRIVFNESYNSPRELSLLIADEMQRELQRRGSGRRIEIAGPDEQGGGGENEMSINIIKSDWEIRKALSIPYILNRYKSVYSIYLNIAARRPDGSQFVRKMKIEKGTGVEAQVFSNDKNDPDLQCSHSKRLEIENEAAAEIGRGIAGKLLSILKCK